jgi:hypothetical protein
MATTYRAATQKLRLHGSLADARLTIGSPRFDALLLWGCPLVAAVFVWLWAAGSALLPDSGRQAAIGGLALGVVILTFAHLVAVVPRAYLNLEVFETHRRRLTIVPVLLIAALTLSPTLLVIGAVLAVFWDVHHSAMQTFGLARIYDMKAGNGPLELRRTDLRLNWALYVGPIAAGAALAEHLASFNSFAALGWTTLADLPSLAESHAAGIKEAAVAAWLFFVGWAAIDYRSAMARGYRLPVTKLAAIGSAGFVSIAAWGFTNPVAAFAIINLFHAVQYFALVWLKEGERIQDGTEKVVGGGIPRLAALGLFFAVCMGFGVAYQYGQGSRWLGGLFIACSLLHFWFDSFVWSVRRKQV